MTVTAGILKFACKALISRVAFAHHFEKKLCWINAARRTHAPQHSGPPITLAGTSLYRVLHIGVGRRTLPVATSSGQTTTCLPSCHWIVTAL